MYQRILVAVDGRAASRLAVEEAIGLARQGQGRVRLVHVIDVRPHGAPEIGVDAHVYRQACRENGHEVLERAASSVRAAGIVCETALVEADARHVGAAIAVDARGWGADLVVAGCSARHGFIRRLTTGVAEGVLRLAPAPLLLVPGGPEGS